MRTTLDRNGSVCVFDCVGVMHPERKYNTGGSWLSKGLDSSMVGNVVELSSCVMCSIQCIIVLVRE